MKPLMLSLCLFSTMLQSCSESAIELPSSEWHYQTVDEQASGGWDHSKLEEAKTYAQSIGSLAWMLVEKGQVIDTFGRVDQPVIVQSVRKSFLSALYGMHNDQIELQATLHELGIDDFPNPLSDLEKQATVEQLLLSKSGIYHAAASSPAHMRENLPARFSFQPGERWYYNNWDFNALGTIYAQQTGEDIFESFKSRIAHPLAMQDFSVAECYYVKDSGSVHQAYHFAMSVRDMARFGLLYLCDGKWNDTQIVPQEWVEQSTYPHTLNRHEGYGYMWWIEPKLSSYSARGGSGQLIMVIPDQNIVFAHIVDRHDPEAADWQDIAALLRMLLNAKT